MYMAYTTNPHLPRVRMQAARLALWKRWSTRQIARYTGFNQSTIVRWTQKARLMRSDLRIIPTESSRPYHHPRQISSELVTLVLCYRQQYRRCAKVIHYLLWKDGYRMSLSSVERILRKAGMVNHSKWKKWHQYPPRPMPEKPGILVEIDSIVDGLPADRLYVYTLLDVYCRWSYAWPIERINTHNSLLFVKQAQKISPFEFKTLQSDHGTEFSKWFTKRINEHGLAHRHSRIRTPSDNGHLERFNRTLQEECLSRIPRSLKSYRKEIPEYLEWYNNRRPHMALNMKSPTEVMRSY